jgi:hypothetical protein
MNGPECLTNNCYLTHNCPNINIKIDGNDMCIDNLLFQKMKFVYNAINDGWSVKKRNEKYIFSKNHEGKKEIFSDNYLFDFVKGNITMDKLLD